MKVNIIKDDNKIVVKTMSYQTPASTVRVLGTVAEYNFNSKQGFIIEYTGFASKKYKSLVNWKKAVQRIFDITVE